MSSARKRRRTRLPFDPHAARPSAPRSSEPAILTSANGPAPQARNVGRRHEAAPGSVGVAECARRRDCLGPGTGQRVAPQLRRPGLHRAMPGVREQAPAEDVEFEHAVDRPDDRRAIRGPDLVERCVRLQAVPADRSRESRTRRSAVSVGCCSRSGCTWRDNLGPGRHLKPGR